MMSIRKPVKKLIPKKTEEEKLSAMEGIRKLEEDLVEAIKSKTLVLSGRELRVLVDAYYQAQDARKRVNNQLKAAQKAGEPCRLPQLLAWQYELYEKQIKTALTDWCKVESKPGEKTIPKWVCAQYGFGPIIAAGLSAHIDVRKAPTAGHIWRFAGLDCGKVPWLGTDGAKKLLADIMGKEKKVSLRHWAEIEKRTNRKRENLRALLKALYGPGKETKAYVEKMLARRPWNQDLKNLCWKIGQSIVFTYKNPKSDYGKEYFKRKGYEVQKNMERPENERLTDGHLENRARRWVVKLFLAHYHHIAFKHVFGRDPPAPYPIAKLGHAHWILPPPGDNPNKQGDESQDQAEEG